MTTSDKPHAARRGRFYFFQRSGDNPGITVSKRDTLPDGDFGITEYVWRDWGYEALWFVDADKFTATERQAAYTAMATGANT